MVINQPKVLWLLLEIEKLCLKEKQADSTSTEIYHKMCVNESHYAFHVTLSLEKPFGKNT